jgi:hypothetical protein
MAYFGAVRNEDLPAGFLPVEFIVARPGAEPVVAGTAEQAIVPRLARRRPLAA